VRRNRGKVWVYGQGNLGRLSKGAQGLDEKGDEKERRKAEGNVRIEVILGSVKNSD
jgi:hypothetical protein